MTLSRRERRHEQTRQEIKQIARQQMAQQGTASLSLRGIAAEMGMSAPSLYNYYAGRDDLVTDLLVDSYTHQAETLEQASASCQTQETLACLLTTVLAYRQWAVEHPTEFALVAGTPIPGYVAPIEQTLPLGHRSVKVLLDLLQRAWDEHLLHPQLSSPDITAYTFNDEFLAWCQEQGYTLPVIALFLECYAFLQGALALEVFGHLPFFLKDPVAFYRRGVLTTIGYQPTETATDSQPYQK
jgi:AcrR family transcriptional regulator